MKIVAPEGTVLDQGDSFWQISGDKAEEMYSLALADGTALGSYGSSVMFNDDAPGDNKITLIIGFVTDTIVFGDGHPKILSIHGLWLQSPDKVYTKILDGEWSFDLEAIGVSGAIPGEASPKASYPPADGITVLPTPME